MPRYGLVEFWRPRPEWYAMSRKEKEEFVEGIRENVATLEKRGARSSWVCTVPRDLRLGRDGVLGLPQHRDGGGGSRRL
jgi:hypothetical protein